MKQKLILGIITISFLLSGCGTSDDKSSDNNSVQIVEQGHITGSFGLDPVDILGDLFAYDLSNGCVYSILNGFDYVIYKDNTASTSNYSDGKIYKCTVTNKYQYVDLNNTTDVNASFISRAHFYDNNTEINYIAYGGDGASIVITSITNGGASAQYTDLDNSSRVIPQGRILYAYKKIVN